MGKREAKLNIKYKYDFCCYWTNLCAKIPIQIHEIHFSTRTHRYKRLVDSTVARCGYSICPNHQSILLACTRFFLSSWLLAWYIAFLLATHIQCAIVYGGTFRVCIDGGFPIPYCCSVLVLACLQVSVPRGFLCSLFFAICVRFDRVIIIGKMSFLCGIFLEQLFHRKFDKRVFVFESHSDTRDLAFETFSYLVLDWISYFFRSFVRYGWHLLHGLISSSF